MHMHTVLKSELTRVVAHVARYIVRPHKRPFPPMVAANVSPGLMSTTQPTSGPTTTPTTPQNLQAMEAALATRTTPQKAPATTTPGLTLLVHTPGVMAGRSAGAPALPDSVSWIGWARVAATSAGAAGGTSAARAMHPRLLWVVTVLTGHLHLMAAASCRKRTGSSTPPETLYSGEVDSELVCWRDWEVV